MAEIPTLLLVEDDPTIRSVVVELLTDEGYEVIEAEDGGAAISILRAYQPTVNGICLVIPDMMMPKVNGLAVLHVLADLGHYVPVVAMSADRQALCRAREAGADDTLPKPFNLDELLARVERNCST